MWLIFRVEFNWFNWWFDIGVFIVIEDIYLFIFDDSWLKKVLVKFICNFFVYYFVVFC